MTFFSDDLFDVFEEKSEAVSLLGQKRSRGEKLKEDENKKAKIEAKLGSSSSNAVIISDESHADHPPGLSLEAVEDGSEDIKDEKG